MNSEARTLRDARIEQKWAVTASSFSGFVTSVTLVSLFLVPLQERTPQCQIGGQNGLIYGTGTATEMSALGVGLIVTVCIAFLCTIAALVWTFDASQRKRKANDKYLDACDEEVKKL
jgi:hypothetical protein